MRVILIEEDRFAEIAQTMKLEATTLHQNGYLCNHTNLTPEQMKFAADEIHRAIHFHFVRWAQSHGASCVLK